MKKVNGMIVSVAGILALSSGAVFAESAMPDLVGNWATKSYGHHHEQRGFFDNKEADGRWVVDRQEGRFFSGSRSYTERHTSNKKVTEGFSGALSRNGKSVYLVDHDEDIMFGEILPDGSIELIIMNDGDKNGHSRIGILEIERTR